MDKKRLFAFKLSNSWITRQDLYIPHFKEYCNITFQNIYQSILPPTGFRRPPNPCQHLISSGYVPTARYLYKIRNQIRKMMSAIIGHNRRGENQCPENTQTRLEQEGAGSRKSLHWEVADRCDRPKCHCPWGAEKEMGNEKSVRITDLYYMPFNSINYFQVVLWFFKLTLKIVSKAKL